MRIIGGRDYYDSAIVFGVDPNYVFERHDEPNYVKADGLLNALESSKPYMGRIFYWNTQHAKKRYLKYAEYSGYLGAKNVIYFCGKKYEFYKIVYSDSWDYKTLCFYDRESLCEFFKDKLPPKTDFGFGNGIFSGNDFTFNNEITKDEYQCLVDNQITMAWQNPNAYYVGRDWIVDSVGLKELQFGKVKSANDAFQEIQQWKFGTLNQPDPASIIVSDDIKIAKHGFDKRSFRKNKG